MLCAGLLVSAMIAPDTAASLRPSEPDPTNSPLSAAAGFMCALCARDALGQRCQAAPHVARRGTVTSGAPGSRGMKGVDMLRRRALAKIKALLRDAAASNGAVCSRRAAAGAARITSDRCTTAQMCVARAHTLRDQMLHNHRPAGALSLHTQRPAGRTMH